MHYKNGREAKNGDEVVFFSSGGPVVGILYNAVAGNDTCNDRLAQKRADDAYPNLDVKGAIGSDLSKVPVVASKVLVIVAALAIGLGAMLWPVAAMAQDSGLQPAAVATVAPAASAPAVALAAPAGAAPSMFQQLNVDHLLFMLVLGLLGWAYKDLNPHLKAWLGAQQADPNASPMVHTAATIGLALDDLAESAAGHILHDTNLTTVASISDAAKAAASDAVDGLDESAENVAGQYLGATGKQLEQYVAGLIKKKVADAKAAGATAAQQVTTPTIAAVAIDAAAKKV